MAQSGGEIPRCHRRSGAKSKKQFHATSAKFPAWNLARTSSASGHYRRTARRMDNAAVFDLYEFASGNKKFCRGADRAIGIGLIGAAGAAIAGLNDS